jgi:hypothetical protein
MINATQMVEKLKDVPLDSIVFVSYLAGRRPSPQAIREAARSRDEGIAPRHFTGHFRGITYTQKWKQPILTVWVEERDSGTNMTQGAYRAFNPSLGRLLTLEVLKKAAPQAQ